MKTTKPAAQRCLDGLRARMVRGLPRMVTIPVALTPDQYEALKRNGAPISRYIREIVAKELEATR